MHYGSHRATITEVNSTSELAILMKNYSVIFMIVHDETIDHDWHSIYAKQARDKALKAKFALTKNPEIVQVCVCVCVCVCVSRLYILCALY